MIRNIILFFVIFPSSYGRVLQTRIVNGTNATPGEFPYMVSLKYYDKLECGGSLIATNWVLTAAHCIYPDFINVSTVQFGTIYLENGVNIPEHTRTVKQAIINENYVPSGGYDNDIGLLELREPIVFDSNTRKVKLPSTTETTPEGANAILTGWGYSTDIGEVFNVLQKVEIKIYSDEYCVEAHNGVTNPEVHICAGVDEGGKGQCTGDSGGPLTVNGVQYGIVSWSQKPCTIKGYPGVFTKVSHYIEWIKLHTGIDF